MIWGLLELFQATGESVWLDRAIELTAIQTELFFDERDGGWFSTTGNDPSVLLRLKEDYDGAEPGAASVTVRNLLLLHDLVGDDSYLERARRTLERYGTHIGQVVRVMPFMVSNVAYWQARRGQVVIVGRTRRRRDGRARAGSGSPLSAVRRRRADRAGRIAAGACRTAPVAWRDDAARRHSSAYVCYDFTCQAPVTDPAALDQQLQDLGATRRIVST